jgi:transposase InsO family protein
MDGRAASLVERGADQSERERLAEEARSLTEPLDPDFVDPSTVGPDELFIGRRSLAWLLPELLASGVFQSTLERGGEADVPPMDITLKEGFTVPYVKGFRRYSPRMQEAMDLEVARQMSMGVIEPCEDAAVQEVVMVRKDDAPNGFRMTLDARAVNAGMVVEPCNPPPVKEMLHALGAKSYYARLDLLSAYWQFPLAPGVQHLSAFRVGQQTYRYRVTWMGGAGASHHVQRALSQILRVYLGQGVWLYIDDVVVAADTEKEFVRLLRGVVSAFDRHRIRCKLSKCVIGAWSIGLLGHILSARGVRIADDKREEVCRLPCPANPKLLRSALGQLNFQRAFIPNYAVLTKPLTAVVNGTSAQLRTPEIQAAWSKLMEAVAAQLSLEHLDYNAQTRVRVDASRQGVGGALFNVRFIDGQKSERLVAVCSHAFTDVEANWATIEQEAFAMIFACRYWFPLLEGIRFVIDGDHRNLAYVHGGTSPKVIRWGLFMQSLSYMYNHIAGVDNLFPDRLSRQDFTGTDLVTPDLEDFATLDGAAESSGDKTSAKHAVRISRAITRAVQPPDAWVEPTVRPPSVEDLPDLIDDESSDEEDDGDLPDLVDDVFSDEEDDGEDCATRAATMRLCQAQTRSQRAKTAAQQKEGAAAGPAHEKPSEEQPKPHSENVAKLIASFHNNAEGHHGIHRTVWALQSAGHQWTRMGRDVAEFIEGCVHCQKNRPAPGAPSQERGSLRQYTLFEEVSIDFIGPFPTDQVENSYIFICVCCFSGYVETFPVEAATAVIAAHCLINIIARYTAPARIRSDRGTHFVNGTIEEVLRIFMITGITTPPYRPQANGIAEVNGGQTVRHLKALVEQPEAKVVWSVVLPLATRIVNHTYQARLGCRPADLVTVAPPSGVRGLLDPVRPLTEQLPLKTEFVAELHRAHESMLDAASTRLVAEQRRLEQENGAAAVRPLSPGDLVLLHYPVRAPSKLHSRVAGPFRVVERKGNLIYARDLTCERVIERDAEMWTPFHTPRSMSETELRKIAATDQGETNVEAILNHRGGVTRSKIEFEILWSDGEKTWEQWKTVRQLALMDTYIEAHPTLRPLAGRKRSGGV